MEALGTSLVELLVPVEVVEAKRVEAEPRWKRRARALKAKPEGVKVSFTVPEWEYALRKASAAIRVTAWTRPSRIKAPQADVDVEFRWLRSHLDEIPDFIKAPSRGAIKEWVQLHTPGNERLKAEFVKLGWQRRMASMGGRVKETVFAEDKGVSAADPDLEARRRLFGEAIS